MLHEYQIVYRAPGGPLHSLSVVAAKEAEAEAKARKILERPECEDFRFVCAVETGPALDWNQRVYGLEEAGEYLRRSRYFILEQQGKGKLPKSPSGVALFTRAQLDEFIEKGKAA